MRRFRWLFLLLIVTLFFATAGPAAADTTHLVRPGDTLYRIACTYGVTIQAIAAANGIVNVNLIYAGQVLIIPGADGPNGPCGSGSGSPPAAPPPAPNPAPVPPPGGGLPPAPPPPSAPPAGANLLPNWSFEEGYYNLYGVPEWQVPAGWMMEFDEGGWTAPGTGLPYLRPESRVTPIWGLPPFEQPLFVFNGAWTLKVFKGGHPMSFRLFTDVYLQAGTYRLTVNYFPDLVAGYAPGKVWAGDPYSGEVRLFWGTNGSYWAPTYAGVRGSQQQTFTLYSPGYLRVGAAFRTRYALPNNGFFLDDWALQRLY
jgi:LysM repeat protein